ncbi:MAG: Rieske (2Fe-2S) protein [Spongiibacteraceae bacterium]
MIALCPLDAIDPAGAKGFEVDGYSLLVVRRDRQLFAYHNRCPHLGVELNWLPDQFLDRDGELIQCATHGALFLIDGGRCIAGPCRGKSLQPIPCALVDGHIAIAPDWPVSG